MSGIDYSKRGLDGILERWRSVDLSSISDSEIEELVGDMYKANRSINLFIPFLTETVAEFFKTFHCHRCGECCVGGGEGVFLLPDDVQRLSTAMQMSKRQFKDKFTFVTGGKRLLPFPCPFYDSNSRSCIVYQLRPDVCRLFPLFPCNKPILAKRFYPLTNGACAMSVSARCPVGRSIACQFLKMQRDVLSFSKKLDKSKLDLIQ